MRIGILTLPLHTNYGGILQAYALQTVLERMGHEVMVVNKEKESRPLFKGLLNLPYRIWKKFVCKKELQLVPEYYEEWVQPVVRRRTNSFIQKNIHVVHTADYALFFRESQVDAIVVGSDQVWRPLYVDNIEDYFGGFDEENTKKKISYAASFGVDKWEFSENQTLKCSRLLEKFDAVSVREETGVRLCREFLHVEALQVLDPTLLLNYSDYVKFITNKQPATVRGKGLFGYILDASCVKRNVLGTVAKTLRLTPYEVKSIKESSLKNYLKDKDNCVVPGVEDWLQAFKDADVVVTDSFHGCVFSIIFHKPFWVLVNPERGAARFSSLLSMLHLEDRVVSAENISEKNWSQPIDWNAVDFLLDKKRCCSLNFLKKNLNSQKE